MNKPKKIRNLNIVKLKDKRGMSFSQIAKEFNIGKQTAYDIYRREKARKELSPVTS